MVRDCALGREIAASLYCSSHGVRRNNQQQVTPEWGENGTQAWGLPLALPRWLSEKNRCATVLFRLLMRVEILKAFWHQQFLSSRGLACIAAFLLATKGCLCCLWTLARSWELAGGKLIQPQQRGVSLWHSKPAVCLPHAILEGGVLHGKLWPKLRWYIHTEHQGGVKGEV